MEGGEGVGDNASGFVGNGDSRMKRSRSMVETVERERGGEDLELSLGLSTNGRFGVDHARKEIKRSSSVLNIVLNVDSAGDGVDGRARGVELEGHAPLGRTCSLPSDTQGWRRLEESESVGGLKLKNVDGLHGGFAWGQPSHLVKGATETTPTGSSSRHPSLDEDCAMGVPAVVVPDATEEIPVVTTLPKMPYVSTRGFPPTNNTIKGFLYRYKKDEDVKIVCVCHGMFLSPVEFVKHGGGGDVEHPLKHIVVNPFPF